MKIPEDYLEVGFREDRQELERTRALILEVARVFPRFAETRSWPYELKPGEAIDSNRLRETYSQSTSAMILFALAAAAGGTPSDCPLAAPIRPGNGVKFEAAAQKLLQSALARLKESCARSIREEAGHVCWSSSFGWDDPFTLTWIHEVERSATFGSMGEQVAGALEKNALERARQVLESLGDPSKAPAPLLTWEPRGPVSDDSKRKGGMEAIDHALPVLRWVRLALAVGSRNASNPFQLPPALHARALRHMQRRVHEQLSESEIRSFQFDASELVFAFEGQLTLDPHSVSGPLLQRVTEVIGRSQATNPYWRGIKPFIATPQGQILLPLSVETANSLLRCCALLERHQVEADWFSQNLDAFKRYAQWLWSRIKRGHVPLKNSSRDFVGWHSEHVHLHEGIHLWETSQVMIFLVQYASMLDQHIATTALRAANLSIKRPWDDPGKRKVGVESDAKGRRAEPVHLDYWSEDNRQIGEPLAGLPPGSSFRIYEHTGDHFIAPRPRPAGSERDQTAAIDGSKKKEIEYSILLYGPPGTGKTSFAEEICKALRWPLISISPSDFIRGGESQVEARAKTLFEVLGAQSDVVVLFDEIDRMILDRDSKSYTGQSDLFQFMTPSMLTKLKDLHDGGGVIFIVATNYAERIDPAAKRQGRIDFQGLLPPPDSEGRFRILQKEVKRRLGVELTKEDLSEVLGLTRLRVYGGLKRIVTQVQDQLAGTKPGRKKVVRSLIEAAENAGPPAISLRAYAERLEDRDGGFPQKAFDEFLLLLYLLVEGPDPAQAEGEDLEEARKVLGKARSKEEHAQLRQLLLEKLRNDEHIVDTILKWFLGKSS